jgi:hypothetical protein
MAGMIHPTNPHIDKSESMRRCSPRIVQLLANCRNFAVEWLVQKSRFQLLTIGALIAI